MDTDATHRYGAGDSLEDLCRACKTVRAHTIIAVGPDGGVLRVICDYCRSQHNYRGGDAAVHSAKSHGRVAEATAMPLVSERERRFDMTAVTAPDGGGLDLELMLRRVIREEIGLTPVRIAEKWNGGEMVLRPGRPGLQDKSWPIETFFHKIVMLRNRLRVLEQQINTADFPEEMKVKMQGYITGCYGTLTSFNVLFEDEDDRFHGNAGSE